MVSMKMVDGTILYSKEPFHQVEHVLRGAKQGAINGFLDKEMKHPVVISVRQISYISEKDL